MSAAGALGWEDPAGEIGDRLSAAGVTYTRAGEVYGRTRGGPSGIVDTWWDSDDTHARLVDCDFTIGGVGVAPAQDGLGPAFVTVTLVQP
jgi:uncharacterized protein YkwD